MIRDYLNLNTLILLISGLLLMAWGGWTFYRYRDYIFGGGIFCIGVGNLLFGLTQGFTDTSPRGRLFFKVAMFAYLFGLLSTGYSMRYLF